jgi:hypothetical protein
MGAWGSGPFENDSAMDWIMVLDETEGLAEVLGALDAVALADEDEYLDVDDCSAALAAAEALAAAHGKPPAEMPEEMERWLRRGVARPEPSFLERARLAVRRVDEASELQELWDEVEDAPDWHAANQDLLARLR